MKDIKAHSSGDARRLDMMQMQMEHEAETSSSAWSVTEAARAASGAPPVSLLKQIMLA